MGDHKPRATTRVAPTVYFLSAFINASTNSLTRIGLADVIIHSGRNAHFPVAFHGVGSHRDDMWLGRVDQFTDFACGIQSIHFGHLHIHEDDIVDLAFDGFYCFEAVRGNIGAVAHLLKDA